VRPHAKIGPVHLNIYRSLTEAKLVAQDFRDSQSSGTVNGCLHAKTLLTH